MVATRLKTTQGGQTRRKGAQGKGKTWPNADVLVPGEWQEPQRWVSSTRNRLQLPEIYLSIYQSIYPMRYDKMVGFHDATRLATLHNSAMHMGPSHPDTKARCTGDDDTPL
jgi:hypothetical protein